MSRDPRYDILFQPIQIGPVTAKNRFYQAPHCTGMGWERPRTLAAMHRVKAEGGWGVVCTEYCSIHPASDDSPGASAALWDDSDVRAHALMTDADGYYFGSVIAEKLRADGIDVTLLTAADQVARWAEMTSEAVRIRKRLRRIGVKIVPAHRLTAFDGDQATLVCRYSEEERRIGAASVVLTTHRSPNDGLYQGILDSVGGDAGAPPFSLTRIGDCEAPSIIASAVYAGHRFATELDAVVDRDQPLKHDRVDVGVAPPTFGQTNKKAEPGYLETLLQYYEEEIAGEAYFRALAERLPEPAQKQAMELLGDVEAHCAAIVAPLIKRYGLTPQDAATLVESGRADAARGPQDWAGLTAFMRAIFPGYIAEFLRLEAKAPPADRPVLRRMTEHELVAVAFLEAEKIGAEDSTAPLRRYLDTPVETETPA